MCAHHRRGRRNHAGAHHPHGRIGAGGQGADPAHGRCGQRRVCTGGSGGGNGHAGRLAALRGGRRAIADPCGGGAGHCLPLCAGAGHAHGHHGGHGRGRAPRHSDQGRPGAGGGACRHNRSVRQDRNPHRRQARAGGARARRGRTGRRCVAFGVRPAAAQRPPAGARRHAAGAGAAGVRAGCAGRQGSAGTRRAGRGGRPHLAVGKQPAAAGKRCTGRCAAGPRRRLAKPGLQPLVADSRARRSGAGIGPAGLWRHHQARCVPGHPAAAGAGHPNRHAYGRQRR